MKFKLTEISLFVALFTILFVTIKGDACGGLLEADAGEFDLPYGYSSDGDLECVWVIQLLSRGTIQFTLDRLDSPSSTVSLYPEHEASETVLNPVRLSLSDVGVPLESAGKTLVVIFTRSDYSSGLSFTWDSVSSTGSEVLTAVNYVDTGSGRLLWNRFQQRERLTWALNLASAQSLALKAVTAFEPCQLLNPCWCSYFGLYEVTNSGYLREVTRVCGRSSSFETDALYPKLVAFVYINSTIPVAATDHVELEWRNEGAVSEPATTEDPATSPAPWPTTDDAATTSPAPWSTTQEPDTSTTPTTTDSPVESTTLDPCFESSDADIVSLGCGGVVRLPPNGTSIFLDFQSTLSNGEEQRCVWSFDSNQNGISYYWKLKMTLVCSEFGGNSNETGLAFIERWSGKTIAGKAMNSSTEYSLPTGSDWLTAGYLSFFSTTNGRPSRSRFVVRIDVADLTENGWTGFNRAFTDSSGSATYAIPSNYDLSSIVINPQPTGQRALRVTVDSSGVSNPCDLYDSIDILEIGSKGLPKLIERVCGRQGFFNYTMEYPIIAWFHWWEGRTGLGANLYWE